MNAHQPLISLTPSIPIIHPLCHFSKEIVGIDKEETIILVLACNWAAYHCLVQRTNGECEEVRNIEQESEVSSVMERVHTKAIYFEGRRLDEGDQVAKFIPRCAVLRSESRKGVLCVQRM